MTTTVLPVCGSYSRLIPREDSGSWFWGAVSPVTAVTFRMNGGLPRAAAGRPLNAAIQIPSPGEACLWGWEPRVHLQIPAMSGSIQYKVLFLPGREGRRGTHPWERRSSFCGQQSVKEGPQGKTASSHGQCQCLLPTAAQTPEGWGRMAASSQRWATGSRTK